MSVLIDGNTKILCKGFTGEAGLAAAQQAVAHALAGTLEAAEAAERAHRAWRSSDYTYIAALVAPVLAAVDARTQGVGHAPAPLPTSSAVAALAAVEANDVDGARVRARTSRWRQGFRGRVSQANEAVAAARQVIGATNPLESSPGSIRGDLALEVHTNLVHGSDSPESAAREIALFFPDL